MGRNVPLGAWTESGVTLHLTAVAPGNPAFAFYQPYNNTCSPSSTCWPTAKMTR